MKNKRIAGKNSLRCPHFRVPSLRSTVIYFTDEIMESGNFIKSIIYLRKPRKYSVSYVLYIVQVVKMP